MPGTERISTSRCRPWSTVVSLLVAALLLAAGTPAAMAATTGAVGGVRDPAAGTLDLSVQASEHDGAGLRSAAVYLAGELLDAQPFADPACGPGTCPAVGTVALNAPTDGVADGPQRLEITVEDGAGTVTHLVDRTITVANTSPTYTSSVTLTIGSGTTTGPSGTTPDPPGGVGGDASGCASPRLTVVLAKRTGKRHRFTGRLTCLVGSRRVPAARGTPIGLRHWAKGKIRHHAVLRVGAKGRFTVLIRVAARRTLAFRARSATGKIIRVRIPVGRHAR
jgi:hypothetical protein